MVRVLKKPKLLLSRSSSNGTKFEEGAFLIKAALSGGARPLEFVVFFRPLAGGGRRYPSHLRPVLVHRRQFGFASSHFTRRTAGETSDAYPLGTF